ncbi:MAG: T9SS type A sorting domain-containing protein [Bacteroidales bacterium]|nr:T9SS type A sorting domain-containing protein [Bacteroidales bacterium]
MFKRSIFFVLLALVFTCNAFAQQLQGSGTAESPYQISSLEDFNYFRASGDKSKYYKQTIDLDLGNLGTISDAIVSTTFSGTYDGDGHTITYSAGFNGTTTTGDYALFSTVTGTITKLNVNANVTLSGNATAMNVALLCGFLQQGGLITFCNVSGNVNSTVNAGTGGGSDAGLIAGESKGTITYCNASGNVIGVGYAGGIVGQLTSPAVVRGCAFTGSVTALACEWEDYSSWGSFAGGICGFANSGTTIDLCYSNADIVAGKQSHAAVSTNTLKWLWFDLGGTPTVTNNYCAGTINGEAVNSSNDITNSTGEVSGNYYEGQVSADSIANALNNAAAAAGDTNIHFSVVNGEVVFGRVEMICETPINLVVENNGGDFTITWETGTDATINETTWHWTLTGGNPSYRNAEGQRAGTTTTPSMVFDNVSPSGEPYIFTVYTDCSTVQNGLLSNSASARFYMFGFGTSTSSPCYNIASVSASEIGVTSATINWVQNGESNAEEYQLKINGGEPIIVREFSKTFDALQPGTTYTVEIREECNQNGENGWGTPATITFTTLSLYETAKSGEFNSTETWVGGKVPSGSVGNIKINEGHIVTLAHTLILKNDCKIINDGVLKITQVGELINTTSTKVGGIVEVETPNKTNGKWTFIGAPFETGYKLECIKPTSTHDIAISKYDYTQSDWSDEWARVSTEMETAEGYFAWPFYSGIVLFTTYGDVFVQNEETKKWEEKSYDYSKDPATALNNADDITISKNVSATASGESGNAYWVALSNPYPAKLNVSEFLNDNTGKIQGNCVYKLTDALVSNSATNLQAWQTNATELNMTDGFFVNLVSGSETITISKEQLTNYPSNSQNKKSAIQQQEYIRFALVNGEETADLFFAHNEKSENKYDIYDAHKLFAPMEMAEPYFVTEGKALVKEEVRELPYYATMNVRSYKDTVMSFVMKDIPSGLKVFIIDGEEMIEMHEGSVYATEFSKGENIDRFKLFVRKADALDLDTQSTISITNCNRLVNVQTKEDNLYVEVYNALGQKVYSTREYNFNLNDLPAGSYVVKAYNKRANESVKIVIN